MILLQWRLCTAAWPGEKKNSKKNAERLPEEVNVCFLSSRDVQTARLGSAGWVLGGEGARLARRGLRRCTSSLTEADTTENWAPSETHPDGSFPREPCGSVCLIRCVFTAAYQRGDPSVSSLRLLPFACLIQIKNKPCSRSCVSINLPIDLGLSAFSHRAGSKRDESFRRAHCFPLIQGWCEPRPSDYLCTAQELDVPRDSRQLPLHRYYRAVLSFTHIHFQPEMFFFFVPLSLRNIISLQVISVHISKIVKVDSQSVLRASDEQQEVGWLHISRWNLSF